MHSATLLCNIAWSDTLQPSCCGFQALCGILEYLRGKKFHKLTCFLYPMKVSKTIMLWFDKIMVCETILGGAWNRSRVARQGSFSKTQKNTFVLFSALFCFISSFLLPLCGWRWQSVMASHFFLEAQCSTTEALLVKGPLSTSVAGEMANSSLVTGDL